MPADNSEVPSTSTTSATLQLSRTLQQIRVHLLQYKYVRIVGPFHFFTFIFLIGAACTFTSEVCTRDRLNQVNNLEEQRRRRRCAQGNAVYCNKEVGPIFESCNWLLLKNENNNPGFWSMERHFLVAKQVSGEDFGSTAITMKYDSGHRINAKIDDDYDLDVESETSKATDTSASDTKTITFNSATSAEVLLYTTFSLATLWCPILVCWLWLKTIKLDALVEALDSNYTSRPVHILEMLFGHDWYTRAKDTGYEWLAKVIKVLSELSELVIFTWFPNMLIVPLTSLAAKNDESNIAEMLYNTATLEIFRRLTGWSIIAYPVLIWLVDKEHPNCLMRYVIMLCRFYLFFLTCVCFYYFWCCVSMDLSLLLSIDISVILNVFLHYDTLIAWTSLLRLSVALGTTVELYVTAHIKLAQCWNTWKTLTEKAAECSEKEKHGCPAISV